MHSRRHVLGSLAAALTAGLVPLAPGRAHAAAATAARFRGSAAEAAADEAFWGTIREAFPVDRSLVNLNNGGVSPSPASVQSSLSRLLHLSNQAPSHTMWDLVEPRREGVRTRLAGIFGCEREELAITRNASESLQICQLGFDLRPGDEVLTTTQDYPRMIHTFRQRQRREGIVLRQLTLPVPAEDPGAVVDRFAAHITPRTRLILMCHMINLTGQILPVRAVVEMARERGVPVVVDGAHTFAHFPFRHADLDCDYYASSLHKWLFAPFGTGMLYVRRDHVADLWPLMAAPERLTDDIRKFEEIGTHPCANFVAVDEAITFHEALGAERKAARLVYLRDRWAKRLADDRRVTLHTSLAPGFACGIATAALAGIDSKRLAEHLWHRHRILVAPIEHDELVGIRVSPSVYTSVDEMDRFAAILEGVLVHGLPA